MIGICLSACRVNLDDLDRLLEMGFDEHTAAEAMRQTNNSLERSLQVSFVCVFRFHFVLPPFNRAPLSALS